MGHLLVAQIAQLDLESNNPPAFQWAKSVSEFIAGPLTHGTSNTFVESACWADDIKQYALQTMSPWHFMNRPYLPDGLINVIENPDGNATFAIQQMVLTLTSPNRDSAPLETSIAMRYIVHLIGDIHQPLHVTSKWNSQFPQGDQGGNLFLIEFDEQIVELHALWDSCMGRFENDPQRPLNATSWSFLESQATSLMHLYPRASLSQQLSDSNLMDWTVANYHLAVKYAYNMTMCTRPSQDYLVAGWEVIQKQLALAGYRLADTIEAVFAG